MSINLYLAGSQAKELELLLLHKGANRLFSQLNDRAGVETWVDYMRTNEVHRNLFIDSGAYTAHTRGATLDVDEYISYVNSHQGLFAVIAQVDKIPGTYGKPKTREEILEAPELSWQNYLYMRERVKDYQNLTPIFHQGEPFKHLERMLETTFDGEHIPYIGISPANDTHTRDKAKWLDHVYLIISKSSNPNVKTHAFGMTSLKLLESYPFYSADSTSWIMTGANGSIMTRHGLVLVSDKQKTDNRHLMYKSKPEIEQTRLEVEERGYTMDQVAHDYKARMAINALFLMEWSKNYVYKGKKKQKQLF